MNTKRFSQSYKYGRVRLRKEVSSGIWQAEFFVPYLGIRKQKSTGTTDKRDAELFVNEYLLPNLNNQIIGKADGAIPLTKLFEMFCLSKDRVCKEKTMIRMRTSWKMFFDWLNEKKKQLAQAKDLTPAILDEYMEDRSHYLKRSGKFISKRTIDNDVMNISTVYKWALKRELVSKNPADYSRDGAITLYDAPETPRPVFTSEEYQALLAEAKGEGNTLIYDIVVVLANTGMRYGELASLTTDALNWSGNSGSSITIRATDDFSPKDKHEVKTIPMRLEVEEVLRRRSQDLKKGERLFRNSLGNTINPNNTRKSFYRLIRQIGIERKERPLDWHAWRRFFVRNAVQSGIPINIIMSWTGHDSISMVMHYSKTIERQDSMSAIQRIKTA